jgi:transcriptional regulator with XRE-family HTH domain
MADVWVKIGEPAVHPLTWMQERILALMQEGKRFGEICGILCIRQEHLRDEIFEIRKWESTMGKGKLTNEQRAAIYDAWKGGITQAELAKQYGVSEQAISQLCKKMGEGKAAAVNQAFEDAVNEMIAETKEPEFTNEDTIVDTSDTIEATKQEVPEAVLKAVQDKIDSLTAQIAVNCERIGSITEQNDRMKERSEALQKWLKEVQA